MLFCNASLTGASLLVKAGWERCKHDDSLPVGVWRIQLQPHLRRCDRPSSIGL